MRWLCCPFLLGLLLAVQVLVASPLEHKLNTDWNRLVSRHVDVRGAVSYRGFARERKQLAAYLAAHQKLNVARLSENAKKAAYINLYNALMIDAVLHYVDKKRISLDDREKFLRIDIDRLYLGSSGIWSHKVNLAGVMVSGGDIEHKLLRGRAQGKLAPLKLKKLDPRIHMALSCAAKGSARLRQQAYTAATVERMLEENMREFVNGGKMVYWIAVRGKIALNETVVWHYDDFDRHARHVLGKGGAGDYFVSYMSPALAANAEFVRWLKVSLNNRSQVALRHAPIFDVFYVWRINDKRNY